MKNINVPFAVLLLQFLGIFVLSPALANPELIDPKIIESYDTQYDNSCNYVTWYWKDTAGHSDSACKNVQNNKFRGWTNGVNLILKGKNGHQLISIPVSTYDVNMYGRDADTNIEACKSNGNDYDVLKTDRYLNKTISRLNAALAVKDKIYKNSISTTNCYRKMLATASEVPALPGCIYPPHTADGARTIQTLILVNQYLGFCPPDAILEL
jgi:hypothetical protein